MNVNVRNLSGENGGVAIKSGDTATGDFTAIQCITNCTFSSITSNIDQPTNALNNQSIPAGTTVLGRTSAATLTSGVAILYKHN